VALPLAERADHGEAVLWSYPSRQDCLVCHTPQAGFVLGVNTRQLNRSSVVRSLRERKEAEPVENQLVFLSNLGLLTRPITADETEQLPRLAAPDDASQPLAERVRSYLDANCAQCHRPGGVRAEFDARATTPLEKQNLLGGRLIAADLGVPGAKVGVPGKPEQSMLLLRMQRREDVFNMPPLASHVVDPQAVELVRRWIEALPAR
jgi:mono/diheme cytochrome c family protein